ncbi:hypothetical protein L9F63_013781, partial [Diploptera punctata]
FETYPRWRTLKTSIMFSTEFWLYPSMILLTQKSVHVIIIVEISKLPDEMSDLEDFDHVFEQENRRNIARCRRRCIRYYLQDANVAKKASVLKRRKSKNRMEVPSNVLDSSGNPARRESEGDVVFYIEEPKAGTPNRVRREGRGSLFTSQTSSVTEAASDEIDIDIDEPQRVTSLTEAHRNAIRAIRKIKYFVARRKFQQARKPYDVRDVIEQYSQGHLNMMVRIKELQRRLDQTLGKPGSYLAGIDRAGNVKPMTIGARLYRVEQQLSIMDKKLDQLVHVLNAVAQKQQIPIRSVEDEV